MFANIKVRTKKPKRGWCRRGAAALELALMMPIFLLLIIGILEFGRAMMIHQIVTNSAREAARKAIITGANDADIIEGVNKHLTGAKIDESGRVIEIRDEGGQTVTISDIDSHDEVTIHIEVPFDQNSFGFTSWLLGDNIETEVKMRRE